MNVPPKNKPLSTKEIARLEEFIEDIRTGKIEPFKEKTERARQNLRKAGLIK